MLQKRWIAVALAAVIVSWGGAAVGQPEGISEELLKALSGGRGGRDGGKDDEFPPLEKVVEGMEKREGFLTLYVDERKQELFAVFPNTMMKEPFLIATSMTVGPYADHQWTDCLVRIERLDGKLLFVQPNTFETAAKDSELADVVTRTYPDTVLGSTRIKALVGRDAFLVDLGELLQGMNGNLTGMAVSRGWGGDGTIATISEAKAFPQNNEIGILYRSAGGLDEGSSRNFGVHYSISGLPKTDYKARNADDRIGYFLTVQEDFTKDEKESTRFTRLINRWNLKKADPTLKLSPPETPIVFYIEKTVPVKYRKAVADGILEWNKAFEKVGIVDAIVVRQQTSDNEFANLDPEDVRYNFFRWIASGNSFAMGPSRTDPRTGQILDADIIFDESMVRVWSQDFDVDVDRELNTGLTLSERRHLAMNPWEHPDWSNIQDRFFRYNIEHPEKPVTLAAYMSDVLEISTMARTQDMCRIGDAVGRELAFATLAMDATFDVLVGEDTPPAPPAGDGGDKPKADEKKDEDSAKKKKEAEIQKKRDAVREELLQQMVRGVTIHEVGHTMGLRHNFKSSSWQSLADIQKLDKSLPVVGSVMEYSGMNIPTDFDKVGPYENQVLGPYDFWAIEYGYAMAGIDERPRDEKEMLDGIAGRMAEPGHQYATDEDLSSPDPLINLWDLSSNPMEYAQYQMSIADRVMSQILTRVVKDDDSYTKARSAFQMSIYKYSSGASIAAKFVGGHFINRAHKGDKDAAAPITVVPAGIQRAAMDMLEQKILAKDAIKIDPKLQQYLAASRWTHRGSNAWSAALVFPIQDTIKRLHSSVLYQLLSDSKIQLLYDSAYRVDPGTDIFTLPELFTRLTGTIFTEVNTPAAGTYTVQAPMISDIRRSLQRDYVSRLIQIALRNETSNSPAVARSLAAAELEKIGKAVAGFGSSGIAADPYTSAHLAEISRRINQTMNASFTINGDGGSSMLFSLLFGQPAEPKGSALRRTPAGLEIPMYEH